MILSEKGTYDIEFVKEMELVFAIRNGAKPTRLRRAIHT